MQAAEWQILQIHHNFHHLYSWCTRITHRQGGGRERDLLALEVQVPPQGMDGNGLDQALLVVVLVVMVHVDQGAEAIPSW